MKVDRQSLSLTQLSCLFRGRREIQLIMTFLFRKRFVRRQLGQLGMGALPLVGSGSLSDCMGSKKVMDNTMRNTRIVVSTPAEIVIPCCPVNHALPDLC